MPTSFRCFGINVTGKNKGFIKRRNLFRLFFARDRNEKKTNALRHAEKRPSEGDAGGGWLFLIQYRDVGDHRSMAFGRSVVVADQVIGSGFVGREGYPGFLSLSDDSADTEFLEGKVVDFPVDPVQYEVDPVPLVDHDGSGVP